METVGKLLVGLIMILVVILLGAFTLSSLWLLFIVPLGVKAISFAHAYGLMLIIGMFKINPFKASNKGLTWEDWLSAVFTVIFIYLFTLGIGHIVAALFM